MSARDESIGVDIDHVMTAVQWRQFERFRRGVTWTPRCFHLLNIRFSPESLKFDMQGEMDAYCIEIENRHGRFPSRQAEISCDCPDAYAGLCKHLCWLVFKVLKHTDTGVFTTKRVPSALLGELMYSPEARVRLYELWRTPSRESFFGMPDAELRPQEAPETCPFTAPQEWPPPNAECSICFDDADRDTAKQCPKCLNCFHGACIDEWFSHRPSCPLCRRIFRTHP